MNTQYLALILLALIAASNFVDFKNFLNKAKLEVEKDEEKLADPIKPHFDHTQNPSLDADILGAVKRWQDLKDHCDREKLLKASSALSDIFPLLAEKGSSESVK